MIPEELGEECPVEGCRNAAWKTRRDVDGEEFAICATCSVAFDMGRAVGQEEVEQR